MTWASIAVGAASVIGGGIMTAKGQSDQKKANKSALAQEQANWEAQQKENLRRYMLSRGVDTANGGRAVNTRLPLWATVNRKTGKLTGF